MEKTYEMRIVEKVGRKYKNVEIWKLDDFLQQTGGIVSDRAYRKIKDLSFRDRVFRWGFIKYNLDIDIRDAFKEKFRLFLMDRLKEDRN